MKRILPILFVFLCLNTNYAQSTLNVVTAPQDFDVVDVRPEFPGGYSEFMKYVIKNFKMPDVEDLSGVIKVSMVIGNDGNVKDIKVLNDIGHGTGEQVVEILKSCPKWIPAQHDGKPVNVIYKFPITIKTE
jgi:hypothetical protein